MQTNRRMREVGIVVTLDAEESGFLSALPLDFTRGFSLSTLNPAYLPALMLSWIKRRLKRLREPAKLRAKYTHFRILVIGRANAGKTTLLKRVCNTTEEPCIYDEGNNNLVRYLLRMLSFAYQPSAASSNRLHKYQLISLSGRSLIPIL